MNEFVTPKQAARAIQVSESSVKRWCDKGVIPTQKTAGGHRRIRVADLLDFLRTSDCALVRPDVIGLPATTGQTRWVIDRAAEQLTEALVVDDAEKVRQITLDLYLAEHSISSICDLALAPAFESIGEKWECGQAEVFQERRSCEIVLCVLRELSALLPTTADGGKPVAIGGAGAGDQYDLGTSMAELVLRDAQWQATSLGNNLPFETLAEAIKRYRPRLFWLSCSHIEDEEAFLDGYSRLYDEFGMDVAFVVGGRSLVESLRQRMKYAAYCDNMQHLESFAQTLATGTPAKGETTDA